MHPNWRFKGFCNNTRILYKWTSLVLKLKPLLLLSIWASGGSTICQPPVLFMKTSARPRKHFSHLVTSVPYMEASTLSLVIASLKYTLYLLYTMGVKSGSWMQQPSRYWKYFSAKLAAESFIYQSTTLKHW